MTERAESRDQGRWRWICVAALLCAIFLAALALGELPLTPAEVWQAITGQASGFTETVVLSWRLPRAVAAFGFGAALGAAGSIFQSLTRNPLGSPDIIGFNTGAYTGVLLARLFLPAATFAVTAGAALLGGILRACVVLLLTARGGLSGNAFVLTGITTAAAGPILFVALAAPHLARLTLPRSHPTLAATLCGALLLGAADCIAAHAFAPVQLPVGAVTVSLGGLYLAIMILLRRK